MEQVRRHLSLMFADLVGYSSLMEQNEQQAIQLLETYRQIFVGNIENYDGVVVEFVGDAIFAYFEAPEAAVQACIRIQQALSDFNVSSSFDAQLRARIGVHIGEVKVKDDALFGDDVNIAARLEPISVADGICISEPVYQAVKNLDVPFKSLGRIKLKNIDQKINAYLIMPRSIGIQTHMHYLVRDLSQFVSSYKYVLTACFILFVVAGTYFVPRWLVPGYTANYVEIADFNNLMTEDGGVDYFSAGITDALRSQLADISELYILDADKGVRGAVRLEGSVQKVGDNLRIVYQLIRRKDKVQIAGGKLDGRYDDVFILQDRLVAEIAVYLANEFRLDQYRPATLALTDDVTAYDYYLRGNEFLKQPDSHENYDNALKAFSTAIVHDEEFALAYAGICRVYVGKYEFTRDLQWATKAEEYCLAAVAKETGVSIIYDSLAQLYRKTGRTDEAVNLLQKAIEIDPDDIGVKLSLAKVYQAQNRLDEAESILQKTLSENPYYWLAYKELAIFYLYASRFEEAIIVYKNLLDITPENASAFSNLGVAYMYLNDFKQAAKAFKNSVQLSPSSWGYSNTGVMYFFSGDFAEAAEHFTQAIRLAPEDFRWYVNLADAQRQVPGQEQLAINNYQKALSLAEAGLSINPNDVRLHQYMALCHLQIGQLDNAKEHLTKALELAPNDVEVLYTSLKYMVSIERFDDAFDTLTQLLALGYSRALIDADPDLKSLRTLSQYKKIINP